MEWKVDVDLFLSAQNHWADDSPHCLMILHEMFLHATSEGLERSGTSYVPRLPVAYAPAGPKGGLTCRPVGTPKDWQERAPRPLSGGL